MERAAEPPAPAPREAEGAGAGAGAKGKTTKAPAAPAACSCAAGPVAWAVDTCRYPFVAMWAYLVRVERNFGWRFMGMITSSHFFIKGFGSTVSYNAALPYFKDYMGLDSAGYQAMLTASRTPWSIKPLIGIVSDVFPIRGYHKRWYCVGTSVLGGLGLVLLATLPLDSPTYGPLGAFLMFLPSLQQATVDLLVEGKYAEKMALMPETGSDILTWTWSNYMAANMLGALLIGVLADNVGPRAIYAVAVPFALQIFYPLFRGWLDEERLMVGPDRRPKWGLVRQHAGVFFLALMMGIAALGLMFVNLMAHDAELLWYSIISSTLLCVMGFYTLPSTMAKANLYMFLTNALYVGVSGPANYFYTAPASAADCREADCQCYVVDGPAFSNTYFITVNGAVGAVTGWIGIAIFQNFMSDWNFRPAFWVTTLVKVVASIFDLGIILRWNIVMGIPDKAAFMLGATIIEGVVEMMDFMPGVILTSRLCPKNLEAVVYALLAGFQNFGTAVGQTVGVYVATTDTLGVNTDTSGGECDFENFKWIIVLQMLVQLLTIPLTFFLVPNLSMKVSVDHGVDVDADGAAEARQELEKLVSLQRVPSRVTSPADLEAGARPGGGGPPPAVADFDPYARSKSSVQKTA